MFILCDYKLNPEKFLDIHNKLGLDTLNYSNVNAQQ